MPKEIDVRELTDPSTSVEHRQKILKGLISQIPAFGPIINEYLPDSRLNKLTSFVLQLKEELESLKEQIDEDYIRRDDITCIVEKSLKAVSETYNESKLTALKNGLINSLIDKDIEVDRKDFYINILNSLSPFHFRMLYLLYSPEQYLSENRITLSTNITSGRLYFFKEALPDMNEDEIKLIISDLISKGLITNMGLTGLQTQAGIDAIKGFDNSFGKKFMAFFSRKK